jgi:hypothetical protein
MSLTSHMDEQGFGDSNSCQKKRVSCHYLEVERAKDNKRKYIYSIMPRRKNTEQLDQRVPPIHELQVSHARLGD